MNDKLVKFGFQKVTKNFLEVFLQAGAKKIQCFSLVVALSRNGHGKTISTVPQVNWLPFYSGLLLGNLMIGN